MAEINVGEIRARLTADSSEFTRNIQAATQALAAFQQQVQQQAGQITVGMQRAADGTKVLQQQLTLLNQQAISQTGFLGQMSAQLQQMTQAIQQLGQASQQSQAPLRALGDGWRTMLQVAGGVGLANSIQSAVRALKDFAVDAVETGARMENLRNSLSALAGSAPAGNQQFEQLFQTAQRLGIAFEPLARGFRSLTAAATQAGLPLADQNRLLTALATEGRRVGASNEEMGRAITALAQVASKGKVSMEELRQQLGEAIPTAMAATARGMGRTTEELEKLIETGAVRFPSFARALARGFEDMQQGGNQAADGLTQAFNRFGNEILRSKDLLTQMMPALKQATDAATTFLKTINDLAAARAKQRELEGQAATVEAGLRPADIARLSTQEQARLKAIQDEITRAGEKPLFGVDLSTLVPEHLQQQNLQRLEEERRAIFAHATALREQARAQEESAAAARKARADQDLQRDTLADITRQVETLRKARADLRREAETAPELFGRERGTPEEQQRFQKEMESRTRPQVEALTRLVTQPPTGVTIPPETLAMLRQELQTYGEIEKILDRIKEAEKARRDAAQETERNAARAASQRLQIEEQLSRAEALTARPTQNLAEQAAQQAQRQFDAVRTSLEKAALTIADNPYLANLAQRVQEALASFGPAAAEQAQIAFDRVQNRQREQVRQMGDQIAQVGMRIGESGLGPLDQALAQLNREFATYEDRLDKLREQLQALARESTPEVQAAIAQQLDAITDLVTKMPEVQRQMWLSIVAASRVPELERIAERSARQFEDLRRLREEVEQLQEIPETGQEVFFGESLRARRTRRQMEDAGLSPEGREQMEQQLRLMNQFERLHYGAQLFEQFAGSVGQAWTSALTGIADGTRTVSEAFREMGRSIMQTLIQITSQEAWKRLISVGLNLIFGAATGAAGGSSWLTTNTGPNAVSGGTIPMMQHGGLITRPTLALLGEAGPELVVGKTQTQALMSSAIRAAPSAGGQAAGGVVIHNHPGRAEAEQAASRDRALGKTAIVNAVMDDLSSGESSKINRMLRTIQR